MNPPETNKILLTCVSAALAISMTTMAFHDYAWTTSLSRHGVDWLEDFMGQTIFEGESPGASDPAIIFVATAFFLYVAAWLKPQARRLQSWRPYLGYIISTALVSGIFMVHSLKWIMGRARPRLVLKKGLEYTDWYEIGPHYITEGIYRGSFPSGHTAAVLSFLTLAYIFAATRQVNGVRRLGGLLWGIAVLAYCLVMTLGRSMSLSHWMADCIFSIFMGWIIIHVMYFHILRVPEQVRYYRRYGAYPDLPFFWELRFCWYLFFVVAGLFAIGIGLRAFWEQPFPWLAVLIFPGIFLVWLFGRKTLNFHAAVFSAYRNRQDSG